MKGKCAVIKQDVDIFDPKKHPFMRKGTTVSQCPQVSNPATDDFVFGKLTGGGAGRYLWYQKSRSTLRVGTSQTEWTTTSNATDAFSAGAGIILGGAGVGSGSRSLSAGFTNTIGGSGSSSGASSVGVGTSNNIGSEGEGSGENSIVAGLNNFLGGEGSRSGAGSLGVGADNQIGSEGEDSGKNSIGAGVENKIGNAGSRSGANSLAVGNSNRIGDSGERSGENSIGSGDGNVIGDSGEQSGVNSLVVGALNRVGDSGKYSGANSIVGGDQHIVGGSDENSALNSLTFGSTNTNKIEGANVLGKGLIVDAGPTYSTTIGTYGSVVDSVTVTNPMTMLPSNLATRTGFYYMDGSSSGSQKVGFSMTTASASAPMLANETILRLSFGGMFMNGGADYAELMEWLVPPAEKLYKRFVDLAVSNPKKIELASNGSYIGITSKYPGIVGNEACFEWNKKYLKDEKGDKILDTNYLFPFFDAVMEKTASDKQLQANIKAKYVPGITLDEFKAVVKDEATKLNKLVLVQKLLDDQVQPILVPRLNPAYDPKTPYVERIYRPEWIPVGYMGQLEVESDGTLVPGGFCKPGQDGVATAASRGESTVRVMWQKGNLAGVVLK